MNAERQSYIIREMTPLSDKDCFYIAERNKTEFNSPFNIHADFGLYFCVIAAGFRRFVGDSAVLISDYYLVHIPGKYLDPVCEQHES